VRGFYKGWAANTLKVLPQNAIRFAAYEVVKGVLKVEKKMTDT
jgi:solute carrier family 25 (mitochondrial phosphate transporter), member 23/24/25/41